jgi:hypothetical protein
MQEQRFELSLFSLSYADCLRARVGLFGRRNFVHEKMSMEKRRLAAECTEGKIVGKRDEVEVSKVLRKCCRLAVRLLLNFRLLQLIGMREYAGVCLLSMI